MLKIYLNFVFAPIAAQCKIEDIWSKFIAAEIILPFSLNLTVNDRQIAITAFWSHRNDLNDDYHIYITQKELNECQRFAPARGQICPNVKLLNEEVETVLKYHPRAKELRWIQNENEINGSAFVCTDKYIFFQHSSHSSTYPLYSLITFVVILLSV